MEPMGSPNPASRRLSATLVGRSALTKHELLGVELSAVVLVLLINFMDSLGGSISTPVLPFYGREFGATYEQIGRLFSAFALAQTAATPVLGILSDRFGRRTVLLLSLLGTALGSTWQGYAGSYNSLLAARAFSGIWAGVGSVCQVFIVDVVPADLQPEYLSYLLSSTQAATLFGPSIGAGLSVLGLNVPIKVQAVVSLLVWPVVLVYLPESPEWLRMNSPSGMEIRKSGTMQPIRKPPGIGSHGTTITVLAYGTVSLCSMVAQMSIISMYAVFAKSEYDLDSLHVGFASSLGALTSVMTNIWVSPLANRVLGNTCAGLVGSLLVLVGSLAVVLRPLELSLAGLLVVYQGMAINASAVACGAACLTDWQNRSTVMTGVRMFKSLGAVAGPVISGVAAGFDVRLPFVVAGLFAFLSGATQALSFRATQRVHALMSGRRTVGMESALLAKEGWQDEYGTTEEIRDLGEYVAELLTRHHYRWVTYNGALKRVLHDFFPPLPIDSDTQHREGYDWVRKRAQSMSSHALSSALMLGERG